MIQRFVPKMSGPVMDRILVVVLRAVPECTPLFGIVRENNKGSLSGSHVDQLPCTPSQLSLVFVKGPGDPIFRRRHQMFAGHGVNREKDRSRSLQV